MKVLVIGSGGREHALVWKLRQSKKVDKIFCAPGNAGISQTAKCVSIKADDIRDLSDFAYRNKISLTIVGPEAPLAAGIADEFHRRRLKIFGPDKKAAQLESSKVFAKEFMRRHHIPTAPFKVFSTYSEAVGFCKSLQFPAVIKADGLAAGKGVIIVKNLKEANATLEDMMIKKRFGKASSKVLIESYQAGQEVSIMAFTDGKTVLPMLPSQDHKQAFDGDRGPNTGGMGAYCPTPFTSPEMIKQIVDQVLRPVVVGLADEGITYRGLLYAGLILTEDGPRVLEFNCRFGDPETQAVLPLMKSDLFEIMMSVSSGKLSPRTKLEWRRDAAVCITMASKGYPGKYTKGVNITGLQNSGDNQSYIFHAGTTRKGNQWKTDGGRVLGVMGMDRDLKGALNRAYRIVGKIKFDGAMYRKDIGFRASKPVDD